MSRLQGIPSMELLSFDVVGQKVIMEVKGSGIQKNGKSYDNRYVLRAQLELWLERLKN
jgi:hypothetical protein